MSDCLWNRIHDWFIRNVPEQVFFTAVGVMVPVAAVIIAVLRWMMLG